MKIQEHSACTKTKSPELECFSTVHCFRNWKIIYLHFPASVYAGYLFESWGPSIEQWQRCPSSIKSASRRGRRWKGKGRARAQIPPSPSPFNAGHAGYKSASQVGSSKQLKLKLFIQINMTTFFNFLQLCLIYTRKLLAYNHFPVYYST